MQKSERCILIKMFYFILYLGESLQTMFKSVKLNDYELFYGD